MKKIQHFILGMQFLTRIPITRKAVPCEPSDFKGAMVFFTVIGAIIGLIQYVIYEGTFWALGEPALAVLIASISGIWLTGGLHLDGLADLADAWGANASKERSVEIMKDSRVGTFGVLAIVIDFAVHFLGMYALREHMYLYPLVPITAKFAVCGLCLVGTSLSKGMGALWIDGITVKSFGVNGLIWGTVMCVKLGILPTLFAVGCLILGVKTFNRLCTQRLGGINGDCLGAISQLAQWCALIFLILYLR